MARFSSEQRRNAQIIAQVGRQVGANERDILIAIMTAMQESSLRNLSGGHLDSVGLFQQRNAWAPGGSQSYRQDPYNAARMFFLGGHQGQRGLLDFGNRNRMSLSQAAQAVQVSAFPSAYAKHEDAARGLMGLGGRLPSSGAGTRWIRPVSGGRITQNFGDPEPPGVNYARGFKNGMSFASRAGSPVFAAGDGRVVRVTSGGAYGNRVEIEHGGKIWTLYAHLQGMNVRVGDQVRAGQQIGTIGSTGQTTGPHLHFELREGANKYGSAVDPRDYLNMNTTPEAYVEAMEDQEFEYTTTIPGEAPLSLMEPPIALNVPEKPYVYRSPLQTYTNDPLEPFIRPAQRDTFDGAIMDDEEEIEPEETDPDATLETEMLEGAV